MTNARARTRLPSRLLPDPGWAPVSLRLGRRRLAFGEGRLAVALALLLAACASAPAPLEQGAQLQARGKPLGRSDYLRSGQLSWQLGQLSRHARGMRVDLRLQNGRSRSYSQLLLRVRVHGPAGEAASVRLAVGGLQAGRSHAVSAHLPSVSFPVRDVSVELLSASP